jgi:hypothetical protein
MNWIKESYKKSKSLKDHYKLHHIDIFIKDKFTNEVDFDYCLKQVANKIPSFLINGVDIIYVGQFDFLIKREINALYDQGAIYITNEQDNEQDIIDDIIHEISHSLESRYKEIIYSDGQIMKEFLGKRKKLYYLLKAENLNPPEDLQTNLDYDKDIDIYIYKKVGYQAMWNLVNGLFLTPYSTTDLREYFAVGFEHYVQGEQKSVKKTCPVLYTKLEQLFDLEE